MRRFAVACAVVAGVWTGSVAVRDGAGAQAPTAWMSKFDVQPGELVTTGRNQYFTLEPGAERVLTSGADKLVITVLAETRRLAGVDTRVVEERETHDGQPVEVSRNYFAISTRTNDVFYFGEDVDMYKAGKVVSHEGAWLAGISGATFGLLMPAQPRLGARYQQEIAPKVAMDRSEILSLAETVQTPAGTFTNCVKVEETTPLEPGVKEYKFFAPGVGLVQDGELKLVSRRPTTSGGARRIP